MSAWGKEKDKLISKRAKEWHSGTQTFAIAYWTTLGLVILGPLVMSAAQVNSALAPFVAVLGLFVAAAAALKEQVSPGTRWVNYLDDANDAEDLLARIKGFDLDRPADPAEAAKKEAGFDQEWTALEDRHIEHVQAAAGFGPKGLGKAKT